MLAMDVNDDAGGLIPRGVFSSIASVLAPTGGAHDERNSAAGHQASSVIVDVHRKQVEAVSNQYCARRLRVTVRGSP